MHTLLRRAQEPQAIEEAAAILQQGGLAVFPTDTVYGVGASALLPKAIEALYSVKGRPTEKAIPLLLPSHAELVQVAREIPKIAWALAERFWPGGLTLVLPRAARLPEVLCGGGDSIAVRIPDHPVALRLLMIFGGPLATTSANLSGQRAAVTAEEAQSALSGQVQIILDGGTAPKGIASTVLDLTSPLPKILREGAISRAVIASFLAEHGHKLV
jgi:L-threonylcarbamoyladenylate synthase